MAEAHQAVAFSFAITHEGWNVDYDREVLNLVWQSGVRSWKKRLARIKAGIRNGAYPAHLESLWVIMILVTLMHYASKKVPYDLVNTTMKIMPSDGSFWHFISCILVAITYWILICMIMRYSLKGLLIYKGWMYEARGSGSKTSLSTKIWFVLVKVFKKWNNPGLYSFQSSIPRLPLPSVHDTMTRWLRSVRPLMDDATYEKVTKEAEEFENGIGKKLQRYLILKSWWSTNYVSDWWEEYVYLRGRSPLMVNSNFYGVDAIFTHPTKNQAARAASVCHLLLQFRRSIDRQELEPIMVQGLIPLCSWQYERTFNTARIPGVETDKIVHYKDSRHIVVIHKGCYYKMPIYHKGRLLKPCELQYQFEQILQSKSAPVHGEEFLASLTAWDRTKWAKAREMYFSRGVNKTSLFLIESAAFVVSLDDEPFEFDLSQPEKLDNFGRHLLHGKGCDRWFDKSFTLCVATNGRIGFNAEHTWADAPIMGHVWECCLADDHEGYDENGNTPGQIEQLPPTPTRLSWSFNDDSLLKTIDQAYDDAQKVISDVDLRILVHDAYGKGFMKTCRCSPDAFIQMALQLAYYRDYGKFSLTYEASMTRLYREGRTETVRPCTIESAAWVKAMQNPEVNATERVRLLGEACKRHQQGYQDAMCGRGIDRHLFCLYVVSKYLEVDSPFLKEILSEPWRLSTSQTPHGQTPKMDLKKNPNFISAGGGFGPVSSDGYGVSYIIAGEDLIFFHISSIKSCNVTDSERFSQQICRALADMKLLFEQYKVEQKKSLTNGASH
ncbi:carnitine O-palmitoyltransferase 1, liver isoform isoform X2 [Chironomus tepperi]|uniref:carnitine O-palmitoyltransferase 1, liver isoform isoform X2 n=1 Tax=Chironomus tepperi TaxID=113505 RepID=UPI00391F5683